MCKFYFFLYRFFLVCLTKERETGYFLCTCYSLLFKKDVPHTSFFLPHPSFTHCLASRPPSAYTHVSVNFLFVSFYCEVKEMYISIHKKTDFNGNHQMMYPNSCSSFMLFPCKTKNISNDSKIGTSSFSTFFLNKNKESAAYWEVRVLAAMQNIGLFSPPSENRGLKFSRPPLYSPERWGGHIRRSPEFI